MTENGEHEPGLEPEGVPWRPTSDGQDLSEGIGDAWKIEGSEYEEEENPHGSPTPPDKQRHGCLTAWLVFNILLGSVVALLLLAGSALVQGTTETSRSVLLVSGVVQVVVVACLVALMRWKKWGFWLYAVVSLLLFALNVLSGQILVAIQSLVGLLVLWVLFQSGRPKAWEQLD